jgi:ABC-type transporter Mla subunit MlaD
MNHDTYVLLSRIEKKVDGILSLAARLLASSARREGELHEMSLNIDALTAAVENEVTVETSAISLIQGLATQIQDLINQSGDTVNPTILQALVDKMTASQGLLAAAVKANTEAAPPPVEPPPNPAPTV